MSQAIAVFSVYMTCSFVVYILLCCLIEFHKNPEDLVNFFVLIETKEGIQAERIEKIIANPWLRCLIPSLLWPLFLLFLF